MTVAHAWLGDPSEADTNAAMLCDAERTRAASFRFERDRLQPAYLLRWPRPLGIWKAVRQQARFRPIPAGRDRPLRGRLPVGQHPARSPVPQTLSARSSEPTATALR